VQTTIFVLDNHCKNTKIEQLEARNLSTTTKFEMAGLPDFDDLPKVDGMPQGCAWGVFDKDDKKDVYGTLNLLTPDVIKSAYSELKDGVSVSLNWPIGAINTPGFGRKGLTHKVMSFVDTPLAAHGYDDEVEFNTQCSSQWDSLCHFHHQESAKGYNGVQTNIEELKQEYGNEDHGTSVAASSREEYSSIGSDMQTRKVSSSTRTTPTRLQPMISKRSRRSRALSSSMAM
jgi:hypothetical protein